MVIIDNIKKFLDSQYGSMIRLLYFLLPWSIIYSVYTSDGGESKVMIGLLLLGGVISGLLARPIIDPENKCMGVEIIEKEDEDVR